MCCQFILYNNGFVLGGESPHPLPLSLILRSIPTSFIINSPILCLQTLCGAVYKLCTPGLVERLCISSIERLCFTCSVADEYSCLTDV